MITETHPIRLREPIGVLGYGVEGASTCRFLLDHGYTDITVFDRKLPSDLDRRLRPGPAGADYLAGLPALRTVFRSAGVRPDLPEIQALLANGGALTSQIGLAFSLAGRRRIIGVTGTLGKGTCCSLLHAMLGEAGLFSSLGGNIGIPALELPGLDIPAPGGAGSPQGGALLILELSSFQLSTLAESPAAAIVLRTTSEHLDWHLSRDEYWLHKSRLVEHQQAEDLLVHCADAPGSLWIAGRGRARTIAYGAGAEVRIDGGAVHWPARLPGGRGFTLELAETRLTGAFNLENLAAAGTMALELGADTRHVRAAARAFAGLEHRLEFVRKRGPLSFYNDSYATRPEAVMGAVDALAGGPLGLILGGSDKRADFSQLIDKLAAAPHLRAAALIGETAERLAEDLRSRRPALPLGLCASLEDALEFLVSRLEPDPEVRKTGGAIALSPACASFGMFANYKERGKEFKRLVQGL